MNIINGLVSGCCGSQNRCNSCCSRCGSCPFSQNVLGSSLSPGCGCVSGAVNNANSRVCCNRQSNSCGCGQNSPSSCGCENGCGCNSNNEAVADIQIVCVDESCNPVCNCVFKLTKADGCCKTIELCNSNRSGNICLPEGCNVLESVNTPNGVAPLNGKIFIDVCCDSCGRATATVSADSCLDDNLSVRKECGVTILTVQFDRDCCGCGNGSCSGL